MNENILVPKCINDLLLEDFFIPDFQRGYRWSSTQVKALLDDIWTFRQESHDAKKEVFYCLQPIVVAPGDKRWIVIDGQQRLTTIHLILTYLDANLGKRKRRNFGLAYQTRPHSEEYLKNPDAGLAQKYPDYYHIYQAYKTIEAWFEEKSGNAEINFVQTLLNTDEEGKNVKVIWYEVEANGIASYIDIFTRLNIGKIPLTNAELIKALLLKKGNFNEERATLKQIQIATEWDHIERTLHQPDFWYFIYDTSNELKYENRIEYLFDLIYKRNKGHEQYYTFFEFFNEAQEHKDENGKFDVDTLWLKVKRYFLTFDEWYEDRYLYHLVGFLVSCGIDINKLKKKSKKRKKEDFINYLHDEIRKQMNFSLKDLEYGTKKNNEKIRKALLLFNIKTLIMNDGADVRFPFDRFKTGEWDIEHIRPQTEKEIKGKKQRLQWIDDIVEYFAGVTVEAFINAEEDVFDFASLDNDVSLLCNELIELYKQDSLEDESFNELRSKVEAHFNENSSDGQTGFEGMDSIGNLALLDETTNRSYKNALFPIKRKKIIENDSIGKFVPICTKNVFLKYYSRKLDDLMYWKESDAQAYSEAIYETLKDYLPTE